MDYEWDESLRTGSEAIDKQHKALFRAMATIHVAVEEKRERQALRKLATFLSDYVVEHFFMEERLAKKYGYPEGRAIPHFEEHAAFKEEMKGVLAEIQSERFRPELLITLAQRLARWLAEHVMRQDLDLARWIQEHAQAEPHD